MEDTTNTLKDIDTAMTLYNKIKMYLSEEGFELRKWETNDNPIRNFLHRYERRYQLNLCEKRSICKVLGLNWNSQRGEFLFEF